MSQGWDSDPAHAAVSMGAESVRLLWGKGLRCSVTGDLRYILGVYWELVLVNTWAAVGSVLTASSPSSELQVVLSRLKAVCGGRGRAGVSSKHKAHRALAVARAGQQLPQVTGFPSFDAFDGAVWLSEKYHFFSVEKEEENESI